MDEIVSIPNLPAANLPLAGNELAIVEQGGTTKQTPVTNLRPSAPTLYVTGNMIGITGSNQVTIPGGGVFETSTVAGVSTLEVEGLKLIEILVIIGGASASTVKVGTTLGGAQIIPSTPIASGEILTFRVDYFMLTTRMIYFTGVDIFSKIYIR